MNITRRYVNGGLVEERIDDAIRPNNPVPPPQVAPIVSKSWPVVLLPLKALAQPTDRGAGDIIARVIGPVGGEAFKAWYKLAFGKSCGCGNRQEMLNARWPC